ncbi:SRPBCC family protein [Streptomyces boninensis]|uniref:SRPBCC family protein n=1 Tax=Streptomyces boninensis TaxID=2039455 RepID=UPI003B221C0C
MQTITVERTVPAPIEQVFEWCTVTRNWQRSGWVLRNRLVRAGAGDPWGEGAVRTHLWTVGFFRERVTAHHPPNAHHYVVERSFPPARHEGGTMTFAEVPEGTRVTWTTTVEIKLPVAAGLATRVVARPLLGLVFGRILRACAGGLADRQAARY